MEKIERYKCEREAEARLNVRGSVHLLSFLRGVTLIHIFYTVSHGAKI